MQHRLSEPSVAERNTTKSLWQSQNPDLSDFGIRSYPAAAAKSLQSCPTVCDPIHPMFTTALLTIAKTRKQPKCPSADEGIKKM